jgi:putative transposase
MLFIYCFWVRLTVQVRLLPDAETIEKLEATMRAFNEAADWLAGEAYALHSANKIALQKTHYTQLRTRFGLSAQMAVRCIAQVCEAYKRDKDVRPHFRPFASVPYDARLMSFKGIDRVSLLTMEGRVIVPFIMGAYQRERFSAAKGQCDLVRRRDGKWFLLVCIDLPEKTKLPTSDFIGVDFGVVNIATTSDGDSHSGDGIEKCRERYAARRQALQSKASAQRKRKKRPKNVRRALIRASGKEAGFRRDVNHCISKNIVEQAKDTDRGIALEDLTHIRERTRFRKPQRARMSGWSFAQLRAFIAYKAQYNGVEVRIVDPRNTSRECAECGHIAKENRPSQAAFRCVHCDRRDNADMNAAKNIRSRALVNAPIVSHQAAA